MKNSNDNIGIDVSDSSIKILQIDCDRNVISYGSRKLPKGVVSGGIILRKKEFRTNLNAVMKKAGLEKKGNSEEKLPIIINLPESKLFTYYMTLPEDISENVAGSYVQKEAAKVIPYDLTTMSYDYLLIEGARSKDAVFIGVQKEYIENYVEAFNYGNFELTVVGSELFALGRALLDDTVSSNSVLIDIGGTATNIGVFDKDYVMHLSITERIGGTAVTKAIAKKLNIPIAKAEKLKEKYGLKKGHGKEGCSEVVQAYVDQIISETQKALSYFQHKSGGTVEKIILAGGSALIAGLPEYIEEKMGIPTEMGNPFKKIRNLEKFAEGEEVSPVVFSNVVGLVLRSIDAGFPQINLLDLHGEDTMVEETPRRWSMRTLAVLVKKIWTARNSMSERTKLLFSIIFTLLSVALLLFVSFVFI